MDLEPGYEAFDYVLPEDRIAQEPLADRSASKLLHVSLAEKAIIHRSFRDVVDLLLPGDLLVVNNTTVTALRVFGHRSTGGRVELLLLKELGEGQFQALARPGRRVRAGDEIELENGLIATVSSELEQGQKTITFTQPGWREALNEVGLAPVPPYVQTELKDRGRYQTVYHDEKFGGSAAAPTAGLHFTPKILADLDAKGVGRVAVTLDVGLDTFRPVSSDNPKDHIIHGERCSISQEAADRIMSCQGRVIAVGTTSVRTLETFAIGPNSLRTGSEESRLFITPGYDYRIIDGMFTNFHMPRTTMMLMISALAGGPLIRDAYQEALRENYRFLSFGDSMLIL